MMDDKIISRLSTKEYYTGYDRIFSNKISIVDRLLFLIKNIISLFKIKR